MYYIAIRHRGQTVSPLKTAVKYLIVPRGIANVTEEGLGLWRSRNVGRPETLFFVDPSAFPFSASLHPPPPLPMPPTVAFSDL